MRITFGFSLVFSLCFLLLSCSVKKGSGEVKIEKEAFDYIQTWDKDICFFTPKANPVESFDDLKSDDFAIWGVELFQNADSLLNILKIRHASVKVLGPGTYIKKEGDIPQVYITWKTYENKLIDARKIVLAKK